MSSRGNDISLLHSIWTGYGAHPASCPVCTGVYFMGWDRSVGLATRYGLVGPGIESRWGRDFPPVRPALGPTHPPKQWVPGVSWG
jgi:hypothetical protein